jgi:hypothetical protein
MGEKLGTDSQIGQPSCCESAREPFFSGAMDPLNTVDDYTRSCYAGPHEIHMVEGHTRTERGMCVAC